MTPERRSIVQLEMVKRMAETGLCMFDIDVRAPDWCSYCPIYKGCKEMVETEQLLSVTLDRRAHRKMLAADKVVELVLKGTI